MKNRGLTNNELIYLQEIILRLQLVKTYFELEQELKQLIKALPFDYYSLFFINANSIFTWADFQLVSAYPAEWRQRYIEKQYWLHEDVGYIEWFKNRSNEVKRCSDVYGSYKQMTKRQKNFKKEISDFGLRDGLMYGCDSQRFKETSILAVVGKKISSMEFNERSNAILKFVTPYFHSAMVRLKIEQKLKSLTPTQLKVMELISLGLKTKEIAYELNKSHRTIEDIIRRVKESLDAHRTPDAIVKLIEYGLLNSSQLKDN